MPISRKLFPYLLQIHSRCEIFFPDYQKYMKKCAIFAKKPALYEKYCVTLQQN